MRKLLAILLVLLVVVLVGWTIAQTGNPAKQSGGNPWDTENKPKASVRITPGQAENGDFTYTVTVSYPLGARPVKDIHFRAPDGGKIDGTPVEEWEGPPGWDSNITGHGRVITFRAVGTGTPGLPAGSSTTFRIRPKGNVGEPSIAGRWCATTNGVAGWPRGRIDKNPYVVDWGSGNPDSPFPMPVASISGSPPLGHVSMVLNAVHVQDFLFSGAWGPGEPFTILILKPFEDLGDDNIYDDVDEVLENTELCPDAFQVVPEMGTLDADGRSTFALVSQELGLYYVIIGIDEDGDGVVDTDPSSIDHLDFFSIRVE